MRKLITVCGLVVVLAFGSPATAEQQPARAATGDNLVLIWNEETLDAIRTLSPGPTVAVRALALVHTAIYDAWAPTIRSRSAPSPAYHCLFPAFVAVASRRCVVDRSSSSSALLSGLAKR